MLENQTTIVGNMVAQPVLTNLPNGRAVANFRIASTERNFDPTTRTYVDGHTSFYRVSAWGSLGDHANRSFHKGQRVIVCGKLSVESYVDRNGDPRTSVQIEARALGHDLQFGTSAFGREQRVSAPADDQLENAGELDELEAAYDDEPAEPGEPAEMGREVTASGYVEIDGVLVDRDGVVAPA